MTRFISWYLATIIGLIQVLTLQGLSLEDFQQIGPAQVAASLASLDPELLQPENHGDLRQVLDGLDRLVLEAADLPQTLARGLVAEFMILDALENAAADGTGRQTLAEAYAALALLRLYDEYQREEYLQRSAELAPANPWWAVASLLEQLLMPINPTGKIRQVDEALFGGATKATRAESAPSQAAMPWSFFWSLLLKPVEARYDQVVHPNVLRSLGGTWDVPTLQEKLERLLSDLLSHAREGLGSSLGRVSIHLVDSETCNAYAVKTGERGYIYVTKGLISQFPSDDELAAVLAHELGHLIQDDASRRIVDAARGFVNLRQASAEVWTSLVREDYTRQHQESLEQELAADRIAYQLLSDARYPVDAIPVFLAKCGASDEAYALRLSEFVAHSPSLATSVDLTDPVSVAVTALESLVLHWRIPKELFHPVAAAPWEAVLEFAGISTLDLFDLGLLDLIDVKFEGSPVYLTDRYAKVVTWTYGRHRTDWWLPVMRVPHVAYLYRETSDRPWQIMLLRNGIFSEIFGEQALQQTGTSPDTARHDAEQVVRHFFANAFSHHAKDSIRSLVTDEVWEHFVPLLDEMASSQDDDGWTAPLEVSAVVHDVAWVSQPAPHAVPYTDGTSPRLHVAEIVLEIRVLSVDAPTQRVFGNPIGWTGRLHAVVEHDPQLGYRIADIYPPTGPIEVEPSAAERLRSIRESR